MLTKWAEGRPGADPADFAPPLLRIQDKPPAPLAGWVFRVLAALLVCVLVWAAFGPLDIVAVAEGKLVPTDYLKIVQPSEQGIVKEILVREGEHVTEGQVLIRMDPVATGADLKSIQTEVHHKRLALRRADAQLAGGKFAREKDDPPEAYAQVAAQYAANVQAYENARAQELSLLDKARHDLAAAEQTRSKL
ncbi:MAG: biotin/lipoyl-binding protein, partial [Candidatus Binatia bacterium]